MFHERRITPSGAWVEQRKPPNPATMTDQELKKKVCEGHKPKTCRNCSILDFCKYGQEFLKRVEAKGA